MPRIDVKAEVTGRVWKTLLRQGARVEVDEAILVVESMKMEIPVTSERSGTLVELRVREGDLVEDGQVVAVVGTP